MRWLPEEFSLLGVVRVLRGAKYEQFIPAKQFNHAGFELCPIDLNHWSLPFRVACFEWYPD